MGHLSKSKDLGYSGNLYHLGHSCIWLIGLIWFIRVTQMICIIHVFCAILVIGVSHVELNRRGDHQGSGNRRPAACAVILLLPPRQLPHPFVSNRMHSSSWIRMGRGVGGLPQAVRVPAGGGEPLALPQPAAAALPRMGGG